MVATPALPLGRGATSNRSFIGESRLRSVMYQLAQLRMNAAFPARHMFRASHSLYVTTPAGEIDPTQRAALSQAAMARGLFTVTLPLSSSMVPPPSDSCHSK